MVPHLPEDIIRLFLESVFSHFVEPERRRTLVACTRVAKSWSSSAQYFLYRAVTTDGPGRGILTWSRLFLQSIAERPILGTYVRSLLNISMVYEEYRITEQRFIDILRSCPNVDHLEVQVLLRTLSPSKISQLVHLGHRITKLSWIGPSGSTILYNIFEIWPSINCMHTSCDILETPPAHRPPFSLSSLSVSSLISLENWRWLLPPTHNPSPTLSICISTVQSELAGREALDILAVYGPNIRCLAVAFPEAVFPLETFIGLEQLVIYGAPAYSFILPGSLHLLAYYPSGGEGVSQQHLSAALRTWRPPHRRVVIVSARLSQPLARSLEESCKQEDIELRLSGGIGHPTLDALLRGWRVV